MRHYSLRCLLFCSGTLGKVLLTLLYMVTAYVVAGRLIMPLATEYREQLQADISTMVGSEISIGAIEGDWKGFSPVISVNDLKMLTPAINGRTEDERAVYGLDNLSMHLDVPRSLFHWEWVMNDIQAAGLSLKVIETSEGKWVVEGLRAGSGNYNDLMLDLLLNIEKLHLSELTLTLENSSGHQLQLQNVSASLQNDSGVHRLTAEVELSEQGGPLQLVLSSDSDPREGLNGQLWVGMDNLDLVPVSEFLQPWIVVNPDILTIDADIWLRKYKDGLPILQTEIRELDLQVANPSGSLISLQDFSGRLSAMRQPEGEWQSWAENLQVTTANRTWSAEQYFASYQPGDDQQQGSIRLQADRVDLSLVSSLLQIEGTLPLATAEILATLSPRGILADLVVESSVDISDIDALNVAADLVDIGVDAWQGAPSGTGIDGFLQIEGKQGYVEFDSNRMQLHLPRLFTDGWQYDSAEGRVDWNISESIVRIFSNPIEVSNQTMSGQVRFELLQQLNSENEWKEDFTLLVGVDHMDASTKALYLPTLPGISDTMNWLDDSIIAGEVYESGVLYRGSAKRNAPRETQSTQALFKARNSRLKFLPEWPELYDLETTVFVSNNRVEISSPAAKTLGISLHDVNATITPAEGRRGTVLAIDGLGEATMEAGLDYMVQSPVQSGMKAELATWQSSAGQLDLAVGLELFLGGGDTRPEDKINIIVESHESLLELPVHDISVGGLNGTVTFNQDAGLQAESLSGEMFGYPLSLTIDTFVMNNLGEQATRISASGRVAKDSLQEWALQPAFVTKLLDHSDGEVNFDAHLTMAQQVSGGHNSLRVSSDLVGLSFDLPAPMNKKEEESRKFEILLDLLPGGNVVHLVYDEVLSAHLNAGQQSIERGQILFGSAMQFLGENGVPLMGDLPADGLIFKGDSPEFDFDQWADVAKSFTDDGDEGFENLVSLIEAQVGTFRIYETELESVLLRVSHDGAGWQTYIDNDRIRGDLYFPDDDLEQTVVDLDYLRFPAPAAEEGEEDEELTDDTDLFADINPSTLPRAYFHTDELTFNDNNNGMWEFTLEPGPAGAFIHEFSAVMPDASIMGPGGEMPAELFWRFSEGEHYTGFIGEFQAEDLAQVLPRLGVRPLVESESAVIAGDLEWVGSPAHFSLARSSGRLDINIEDGRFVEIDAGSSRLLGALNFDSLVRRLQLDFSDLYQTGLAYDSIQGSVDLDRGVMQTDGPFRVIGPSSRISLEGQLDLAEETIDADLMVSIPIGQNISVVAGLLGAWPVAISTYLASRILEEEMGGMTTVNYHLEGPLDGLQAGFSPAEADSQEAEDTFSVMDGPPPIR